MTYAEKMTAIKAINEIQEQIEAFEASWRKAYDNDEDTNEIDAMISKLLSKRNGMQMLMTALGIDYTRRDWLLNRGTQSIPHTAFYLA